MQTYFNELADAMTSMLTGEEVFTCSFDSKAPEVRIRGVDRAPSVR